MIVVERWSKYKLGNAAFSHDVHADMAFHTEAQAQEYMRTADSGLGGDTYYKYAVGPQTAPSLTITGWKDQHQIKAFLEWFSHRGEQDFGDHLDIIEYPNMNFLELSWRNTDWNAKDIVAKAVTHTRE